MAKHRSPNTALWFVAVHARQVRRRPGARSHSSPVSPGPPLVVARRVHARAQRRRPAWQLSGDPRLPVGKKGAEPTHRRGLRAAQEASAAPRCPSPGVLVRSHRARRTQVGSVRRVEHRQPLGLAVPRAGDV